MNDTEGDHDSTKRRARQFRFQDGLVLVRFFLLATSLTWACQLPVLLVAFGVLPPLPLEWRPFAHRLLFVGTFGPAVAAGFLARQIGGPAAVADLGRQLLSWRVAPRWLALAIALPVVEVVFHMAIATLSGGEARSPATLDFGRVAGYLGLILVATAGEELGWRGYALPRLLARHNPLVASLILSVFWAGWHLPTFLIPSMAQHGSSPLFYMVSVAEITLFLTLFYVRSGRSLPVVIGVHALYDTALWITPALVPISGAIHHYEADLLFLGLLAVLMLALDRRFWFAKP